MFDEPQELVIFSVALVTTREGQVTRPRMLILSKPSIEGAATSAIASQWISAVKASGSFPVVHDLTENLGMEVMDQKGITAPARPEVKTRVNYDHPVFSTKDEAARAEDADSLRVQDNDRSPRVTAIPDEGVVLKK